MRDRYLKLLILIFIGFFFMGCFSEEEKGIEDKQGSEIKLIVATDLHYISPSLTDHGEYFTRMVENADGKYMTFCEEIIDAFIEEVIDQHPSALILSGDITFNGAKLSHQDLAKKLKMIEDTGIPVLVLPGNHDLNNKMAASFQGNGYYLVESVESKGFEEIYEDCGGNLLIEKDPNSLSYLAKITSDLWILMVDVNTKGKSNRVLDETIDWIEKQLQAARSHNICVISVTHQNLLRHNEMFYNGFVIENGDSLIDLYDKYDVLLNLSGHMHIQHIEEKGKLNEIATSSLMVSPNQYGIITVSHDKIEYHTKTVDFATWAENKSRSDLTNFMEESYDFFRKSSSDKFRQTFINDPEGEQIADFVADLNCAYFGGYLDKVKWDEKSYEKIQSLNSYFSLYIRSIVEEGLKNHQKHQIELKK